MEFIDKALDEYCVAHSQKEPQLLRELSKETWQKVLIPRMLSGHFQGRLLSLLSKMIAPQSILEVGTYKLLFNIKSEAEIHLSSSTIHHHFDY